MLKLVGETTVKQCTTCNGTGKMQFNDYPLRNGQWGRGGGVMPCSECKGRKVVSELSVAIPGFSQSIIGAYVKGTFNGET